MLKEKKLFILFLFTSILFTEKIFSFNFLIDIFYSALPQPIKSAFKAEGLQTTEISYGFGNCNFACLGYLNSNLKYKNGTIYNENYDFKKPTYFICGGYTAHVSTPVFLSVFPGWELATEFGYGGIDFDSVKRENAQSFFITGLSGFNWRLYKSPTQKRFSWATNLGFGYKISTILKEELYYNLQIGIILIPKKIGSSIEYFRTIQAGSFFLYSKDLYKSNAKEEDINVSINFLINENFTLKLSWIYKDLYILTKQLPEIEKKVVFRGITLRLISK